MSLGNNEQEYKISTEQLCDVLDEAWRLWRAHWEETEQQYRAAPLKPDIEQFIRLQQTGMSRYYTMRHGEELVGHVYYIVHKGRHTCLPSATEDFFFIMPEHRKGWLAIKLIKHAVQELRKEGIHTIGMSSKLTAGKDIEPLLRRVGFKLVAKYYVMTE